MSGLILPLADAVVLRRRSIPLAAIFVPVHREFWFIYEFFISVRRFRDKPGGWIFRPSAH